jgi:hypothetical protein
VTTLDGVVVVAWRTVNETNVSSFTLYRRADEGEWTPVAVVAAQHAGESSGADYAVVDGIVERAKYALEVVRLDQGASRHGLGAAIPARRIHLPLVTTAPR